jgi:hypothetical protein
MSRSLGSEGFVWWFGIVEDRNDPLNLGRVRVRIFHFHSENKALLPTDQLPWAIIIMPGTSASNKKVGVAPTGITLGSTVIGFFLDGNDANQPAVMGTIHGIPDNNKNLHDVSSLARGINSVVKEYDSYEPSSAFAAKYPFNKVIETESGHVVELDDTPGEERLHIFHKRGTYTEINKDGNKVDKVVGDHIDIILGNETVHIKGNVNIKVDGNYTMNVDGDIVMNGRTVTINQAGAKGAARLDDAVDSGDGGGDHADGSNKIEGSSKTVFIGD